MNRDEQQLKTLLQAADRAAPPPDVSDDLIRTLRAARWKNPLRLRTAAAAAVVMLAMAWSWRCLMPVVVHVTDGARSSASIKAAGAQILPNRRTLSEWPIDRREALAVRTLQLLADRERLTRAREAAARAEELATTPSDTLDKLAQDLLLLAQRQLDAGYEDDAAERFQRVLRVFSDTPWARVAKMRLNELEGHSASRPAARES